MDRCELAVVLRLLPQVEALREGPVLEHPRGADHALDHFVEHLQPLRQLFLQRPPVEEVDVAPADAVDNRRGAHAADREEPVAAHQDLLVAEHLQRAERAQLDGLVAQLGRGLQLPCLVVAGQILDRELDLAVQHEIDVEPSVLFAFVDGLAELVESLLHAYCDERFVEDEGLEMREEG